MRAPHRVGPRYLVEPLAPAVIWIVYFMVVYLFAEAACTFAEPEHMVLGLSVVSLVTLVVTAASTVLIGYFTLRSWGRWREPDPDPALAAQTKTMGLIGVLSGMLFMLATISVGLPALVLVPC